MEPDARQNLLKVIGPGLLFAGSAIGVSHLVQSTRAGAMYGLALIVFIALSMFAKYPAFFIAPRYAAATGTSLLSGYWRQGRLALFFFAASAIVTMFIGTTANLLITAGLAKAVIGLELGLVPISVIVSLAGMTLLIIGHYHWLDIVIKAMVVFLTLATLAATVVALPMIDWSVSGYLFPRGFDMATILFIAALVGWIPTPLDVSVWQSQWVVAKMRDTGYRPSGRESRLDFNIGYLATFIMAICFVVLGTAVMHGSGAEFEASPAKFAAQVIGLYETALGEWSGFMVGIAALAVMFSTCLTIFDGLPRSLANFALMLHGKEEHIQDTPETERQRHYYYWAFMVVMLSGSIIMLSFFLGNLGGYVDFAATISFLGAPIIAFLNHRAMSGEEVSPGDRLSTVMRWWSIGGMVALVGFALLYIYLAFIL
jgi:Mn2+/Fe2+ NRAMP family transporter